jgi:hypothetical protein
MVKVNFLEKKVVAIAISLVSLTMLAGCDPTEETPKAITVADSKSLTQAVFADESKGESGVTFITTGAWTSEITTVSAVSATAKSSQMRAATATSDWISIDPASGDKAGSYTIAINLVPNSTGADRSATVKIVCEDTEISISVTQKATKEDGTVPDDNPSVITATVENGNEYNALIDEVQLINGDSGIGTPLATGNWQNGGFSIEIPSTVSGEFLSSVANNFSVSVSDQTANICAPRFYAYKNGSLVGILVQADNHIPAFLMNIYTDKACNVIGTADFGTIYNLSLKAGWNTVYAVGQNPDGTTQTVTTTRPSGVTLKWYFMEEEGGEPDSTIPFEESISAFENLYQQVYTQWLDMDAQYSTLQARQSVTAASGFLLDFWQNSYEAIKHCNNLLTKLETSNLSEERKVFYRGKASAYRGSVYFYLNALFGGIPLTTDVEIPETTLPRAAAEEINDFVTSDLMTAAVFLSAASADSIRLTLGVQALQRGNFQQAKEALASIIDSGMYRLVDVNGDGLIDADERAYNTFIAQAYLLAAEANLNMGNTQEALQYVNMLYMAESKALLSQAATLEEIRTAIQTLFADWDGGLKFLNKTRWAQTENWGARQLMPIPQNVMNTNPNIVQNPGW